jgi:hypothetical protein
MNFNSVNKVTIDRLKAELNELEIKCKSLEKDKLVLLEKQTSLDYGIKNNLLTKLKVYKIKYKKCLNELKCFDGKFFEEIEDIKYYLQESLKLNEYYENLLHISNGEGRQMSQKYEKLSIFKKVNCNDDRPGSEEEEESVGFHFGEVDESLSTIKTAGSYSVNNERFYSDSDED